MSAKRVEALEAVQAYLEYARRFYDSWKPGGGEEKQFITSTVIESAAASWSAVTESRRSLRSTGTALAFDNAPNVPIRIVEL